MLAGCGCIFCSQVRGCSWQIALHSAVCCCCCAYIPAACTPSHFILQGSWHVKDTSTNGTFIDGAKLGKGNSGTLLPGQRLGLSLVAPAAPAAAPANSGFVNTVE